MGKKKRDRGSCVLEHYASDTIDPCSRVVIQFANQFDDISWIKRKVRYGRGNIVVRNCRLGYIVFVKILREKATNQIGNVSWSVGGDIIKLYCTLSDTFYRLTYFSICLEDEYF